MNGIQALLSETLWNHGQFFDFTGGIQAAPVLRGDDSTRLGPSDLAIVSNISEAENIPPFVRVLIVDAESSEFEAHATRPGVFTVDLGALKRELGRLSLPKLELQPALFLDRDGVIIENVDYISDPADVQLIPETVEVIRLCNEKGIPCHVITNQSGLARGYFDLTAYRAVSRQMQKSLAAEGAALDGIWYAPFYFDSQTGVGRLRSNGRKPSTELLYRASRADFLDLHQSFFIGDRFSDILCAGLGDLKGAILFTSEDLVEKEKAQVPENCRNWSVVTNRSELKSQVQEWLSNVTLY